MKKSYYWDTVSEEIGKIFRRELKKDMSILEIGFSSGHFLEWLNELGYKKLTGIEIREGQYKKTLERFKTKNIELILGDVLEYQKKFDALFSTGLIQCLDNEQRINFLDHVSQMADIAIFTVPEISSNRNIESNLEIAVEGCKEFATGSIPYELSLYYDTVRIGKIDRSISRISDIIIYYICVKE